MSQPHGWSSARILISAILLMCLPPHRSPGTTSLALERVEAGLRGPGDVEEQRAGEGVPAQA